MSIRDSFKILSVGLTVVLGGVMFDSCAPETIEGDINSSDLLSADCDTVLYWANGGARNNVVTVTSKHEWYFGVTYPEGQDAWLTGYDQTSENTLTFSETVGANKPDGVAFKSREALLHLQLSGYPDIRQEIVIYQDHIYPVFGCIPAYDTDAPEYEEVSEGLADGFDISSEEYTFKLMASHAFPIQFVDECDWIETSAEVRTTVEEAGDGLGETLVTVTVKANPDQTPRSAEIKLGNVITVNGKEQDKYRTIKIRQGKEAPNITLSQPPAGFINYKETSFDLTVTSNCEWTISSTEDWVTFSQAKGDAGTTTLSVTTGTNTSNKILSAKIDVISEGSDGITESFEIRKDIFYGISYTTTDGNKIMIPETGLSEHSYKDGMGIIVFKEDCKSIKTGMFNNCSTLKTITLPVCLTELGNSAFSNCTALETVTWNYADMESYDKYHDYKPVLPNISSFGSSVFYNCTSLQFMAMPGNMTMIPTSTFENCTSLKRVYFPDNPSDVTIGYRAFFGCKSLLSTTLENGVESPSLNFQSIKSVNDKGFYGCSLLKYVPLEKTEYIGEGAFMDCTNLTIGGEFEWIEVAQNAFRHSGFGQDVDKVVLRGIKYIGSYAFNGSEIKQLHLSNSGSQEAVLGAYAFFECLKLKEVSIPSANISSFGIECFANCTALTDILITPWIETIEKKCFAGCSSLLRMKITKDKPPVATADIFGDKGGDDPYNPLPTSNPLDNPDFKIIVLPEYIQAYESAEFWRDYPLEAIPLEQM